MLKEILAEFFERDLKKLQEEINLYDHEEKLWKITGSIKNSGGNLALHLIGNLNHFIGAVLGGTGYVRNRDAEFEMKNVPRAGLINKIDETTTMMRNVLSTLKDDDLDKDFPIEFLNRKVKTGWLLFHLTTHFNYHLGQINYHRRSIL